MLKYLCRLNFIFLLRDSVQDVKVAINKKNFFRYSLQAVVFKFSKNLKVKQAYTKYKWRKLNDTILSHFGCILSQPSIFVWISLSFCVPFSSSIFIVAKDSFFWTSFSVSIFGSVLKIFGSIFVFGSLDWESKKSVSRYQQIAGCRLLSLNQQLKIKFVAHTK